MFVVSVSKNKIKKATLIGALVIAISLGLVLCLSFIGSGYINSVNNSCDIAADESDILAFISGCGWQVDEEPIEIREVVIPEAFDDVYNQYNQIQLKQGYNLEKYAGQRVKRWSYIIRNYPETSPEDDYIRINVLVSDDRVIGGDVCSVKLDGFMHGFYIMNNQE